MRRLKKCAFIICIIFSLQAGTLQRELGFSHDVDEWMQMKWDSILQDPNSIKERNTFSNSQDSLIPFESTPNKHVKNKIKLSESELTNFSEDEVFVAETKKENIKGGTNKETNLKDSHNLDENENSPNPDGLKAPDSNLNLDNSQLLLSDNQGADKIGHQTDDSFDSRSFIFNPNARPEEQFQNCTTPKNESGTCRYLQHCMIPSIVGALSQFMEYVCIIEERYIGVCCPVLPATIVVVQEQKEENDINEHLENDLNENQKDNSTMEDLNRDRDDNSTEDTSNRDCGISTNTRIVGGSKADPKAWPWMVALFSKFRKRFFCGGVLINDRYVLTAAHCTFEARNNEIIARVGEYDFKDDGGTHDDYAVVEIKRHAHYNRRTLRNDVALLKLEKPVVFNEFIKTICFPEGEKDYIGEKATLAGWGNIAGDSKTSDVLLEASFPVISNEECSQGHRLPIPESLICTGAEAGDKGACNGDSGGPLMLLDKNNRWKVIGLVSWGRRGCNPEFPTVYTRVSYFLDWIRKHSR